LSLLLVAGCAPERPPASPETDIFLAPLLAMGEMISVGEPVNITDRAGYDNQPAFSSDGLALLYASRRGEQSDIYRYDLETEETRQLTNTLQLEYSPTPIPGDDGFSVVRVGLDGRQTLWRFEAEGNRPTPLVDFGWEKTIGYHAWCDEETIAVYITGDRPRLELVDLPTGSVTIVAEEIGRALRPVPGKHALSYVDKSSDEDWWVVELDLDTLETRRLLVTDSEEFAWDPSGLLFTSRRTNLYYWHESLGARFLTLGNFSLYRGSNIYAPDRWDDGFISRIAIHPDGTQIAMVASRPH
jgi:hypothetical protein